MDKGTPKPLQQSRLPFKTATNQQTNSNKKRKCVDEETTKFEQKKRRSDFETKIENFSKPITINLDDNDSNNDKSKTSNGDSASENNFDNKKDSRLLNSKTDDSESLSSISIDCESNNEPKSTENSVKKQKSTSKKERKISEKRRLEIEKRKEEKLEREREKAEQKRMKEEEKQKLKELKEKERIEREEKRKERELEKEEKRKDKELKIQQKLDEKRKKEEEQLNKIAEKKQKEEVKIKKNEKTRNAFINFFEKKDKPEQTTVKIDSNLRFLPFQLSKNQRIAPLYRATLKSNDDDIVNTMTSASDYLKMLKNKSYNIGKSDATWKSDYDIEIIDDDTCVLPWRKVKLLQFRENYRPAYYGTFTKKSKLVTGRRPFSKETCFDYSVDSDDEWEEEEPGESISHSEGEDDDEKAENDDEENDGFFVPHGYLSDDEICIDEDDEKLNPEKLKARQIAMARAFEEEMQEQPKKLKPIIVSNMNNDSENSLKYLANYQMVLLTESPISFENFTIQNTPTRASSSCKKKSLSVQKLKAIPEDAMPHLIRFIHGNWNNRHTIISEFKTFWQKKCEESKEESIISMAIISKRQLEFRIKTIAQYEKRNDYKIRCWYVNQDVIDKYQVKDLIIPNPYAQDKDK